MMRAMLLKTILLNARVDPHFILIYCIDSYHIVIKTSCYNLIIMPCHTFIAYRFASFRLSLEAVILY